MVLCDHMYIISDIMHETCYQPDCLSFVAHVSCASSYSVSVPRFYIWSPEKSHVEGLQCYKYSTIQYCRNRRMSTIGDFWWPDLWPAGLIKWPKYFYHDFAARSNAACRVSLRNPGAKLDGGGLVRDPSSTPRKKIRPPARRGLMQCVQMCVYACRLSCLCTLFHFTVQLHMSDSWWIS